MRLLNKRGLILVAIFLIGILGIPKSIGQGAAHGGDFDRLDVTINYAMKKNNISGMALAITRGGEVVYSQGYGTAGGGSAVTPDTSFYIGSQSKSFTALAIMQLVEAGQLDLDKPVQTYLPWFEAADASASKMITIRHLLQHTSGLSEAGYVPALPADASLEELVRDLAHAKLSAPVGTKMQYFNPGYSTLGLLIEKASGQTYADYITEHIFEPLGMSNSYVDAKGLTDGQLSQGYMQLFMLALPASQPVSPYDVPAGYLISSANDMARYLMAMEQGGELDGVRILSAENVKKIFTPNSAIQSSYGFGWYISHYYGEKQIIHGGDTERFHTSVLVLPDSDFTLTLLINENHLLKDYLEYNTLFWTLCAQATGHPVPSGIVSSIVIGWGMFLLWLLIVIMTIRSLVLLPTWKKKVESLPPQKRWAKMLGPVISIVITALIVTVIGPMFIKRGFSMKWFLGFLPDVGLIAATSIAGDLIQLITKGIMIGKLRRG